MMADAGSASLSLTGARHVAVVGRAMPSEVRGAASDLAATAETLGAVLHGHVLHSRDRSAVRSADLNVRMRREGTKTRGRVTSGIYIACEKKSKAGVEVG